MTVSRPSVKNAVTVRICALYGDFSGRSDSGFSVGSRVVSHAKWDERHTDTLRMRYDVRSSSLGRTWREFNRNAVTHSVKRNRADSGVDVPAKETVA